MPLRNKRPGAFRKLTRNEIPAFDVNNRFGLSIDCVEMRSPVLTVENADYNSEEAT